MSDSSAATPLEALDRMSGLHIVVWADLVADEFIAGEIARVSREAPVLILKQRETRLAPGGGANAAANLAALGVRVSLLGVVGDDASGKALYRDLGRRGIGLEGVRRVRGRTTPTKTRILAAHAHTARQQVLRLDREPPPLPTALRASLAAAAARLGSRADAVLLSDYGYGSVSAEGAARVRRQCRRIPICVDARYDIATYRGLTAATPNEAELEAALGVTIGADRPGLERAGRRLLRRLECAHLLVTRGRDGMALFEPGHRVYHLAVCGSDVAVDVTGAGDTVIAVFTAALAAGADGPTAAALANCAGGLVVMKRGTATVTNAELRRAAGEWL